MTTGTSVSSAKPMKFGRMKDHPVRMFRSRKREPGRRVLRGRVVTEVVVIIRPSGLAAAPAPVGAGAANVTLLVQHFCLCTLHRLSDSLFRGHAFGEDSGVRVAEDVLQRGSVLVDNVLGAHFVGGEGEPREVVGGYAVDPEQHVGDRFVGQGGGNPDFNEVGGCIFGGDVGNELLRCLFHVAADGRVDADRGRVGERDRHVLGGGVVLRRGCDAPFELVGVTGLLLGEQGGDVPGAHEEHGGVLLTELRLVAQGVRGQGAVVDDRAGVLQVHGALVVGDEVFPVSREEVGVGHLRGGESLHGGVPGVLVGAGGPVEFLADLGCGFAVVIPGPGAVGVVDPGVVEEVLVVVQEPRVLAVGDGVGGAINLVHVDPGDIVAEFGGDVAHVEELVTVLVGEELVEVLHGVQVGSGSTGEVGDHLGVVVFPVGIFDEFYLDVRVLLGESVGKGLELGGRVQAPAGQGERELPVAATGSLGIAAAVTVSAAATG